VAFSVVTPDVAANKRVSSVWVVAVEGGGAPKKLVDLADRPRWSSDGKTIFYTSTTSDPRRSGR
jgi:Tol biopolymer transport system component